jgi:hypothetical protein
MRDKTGNMTKDQPFSSVASSAQSNDPHSMWPNLFVIPLKNKDDSPRGQYESYNSTLWNMRDQVCVTVSLLRMHKHTRTRTHLDIICYTSIL